MARVTALADLAADLGAARFTVDALGELWGEDAAAALHRGQRVPALRAIKGSTTPTATLATVFVLGLPALPDALATALPTLGFEGAVALGLVDERGAPLLDLRPYSFVDRAGVVSWWIASDLGELALGHAIPEQHVLGVGGASTTLSGLMIDSPVDLALDLGTGCGIQAMHAARHAKRVVATDISQRALELAAFNAELNGITNIEFRLGSLFEPVAERFGHVISNPPFVITPRAAEGVPAYEYRDGGMIGDALVASVIKDVEKHLEPGGVAQLLGNWEYGPGLSQADGLARVEQWVRFTGLDAWVIERERQHVEHYAETWIRDGGTRPGAEFDRLYDAWLDDFNARGVTQVGFGYITLRRPKVGGPTLRRFEILDGAVGASLGERVSAVLDAHDWLAATDDTALAMASLTVAADVTEQRHYWPGDEHPTVMDLRQGSGFARTVPLGTALAAVVGACDGTLPIGVICDAVAQLLDVDATELSDEVLPQVRELVLTGILLV
ncbi:MAG: methyltransferase [Salinibacterium sp.]|nr:methyltransferase [Salinibacterium sp.]